MPRESSCGSVCLRRLQLCVYREDLLALYIPHCGHQKSVRNSADRVPKASFLAVRDLLTLSLGQKKAVVAKTRYTGEEGIRKGFLYYCSENNQRF